MIIIIIVIVKEIMINVFADFDVHYLPGFGDISTMGRRWKTIVIINCFFFKSIGGCFNTFQDIVMEQFFWTYTVQPLSSLPFLWFWYFHGRVSIMLVLTSHQHWQWHARHRCHCRRREHAASCSGLHIQCSICTNPTGVRPFHFSNPTNTEIIMIIIISVLLGVFSTVCKKNEDYGNWTVVRDDGDD